MRKIERRNDPGEPLDYLDIKKGAGHTHIVDTENANGIKTQKPVSIANDVTGERAKMQNSTIGEMNQLYQDTMR